MIKALLFFVTIYTISTTILSQQNTKRDSMKIRLVFDETILTATMIDNPTTRDFISLLPLTLKLEDYAGTEKISQLPKKISTKEEPAGADPSTGDIAYYSPWGNLAIFYKDFRYSSGLILLGKIDSDIDIIKKWKESKVVKFELINQNESKFGSGK